ncbi:hypothetical protein GA0074694_1628 [Micromonospora inyonensis]|uniref:PKD domain-containing protein n=1 Tax=Micromonospora inyonensis TaxID=47866 RepID=A0A1C6RGZ5_9ACTN|nr:hypothetical protein GA0074694_1628 [Micromonospora inyonensis]
MLTREATAPRGTCGAGPAPARSRLSGAPHRLVAALLAALTGLALTTTAPAPAVADPGAECPVGQSDCSVWDDEPGIPGGGGGDGGGGDGGDDGGGGPAKCQWNGRTIPCYDDVLGWFDNSDGCYYKLAEPQPADTPEGKQAYVRTCNGGDLGSQETVFLDAPPPGFGAPPDPEELAFRALASIDLLRPRISVAPRKSQGPGLVGLPVWLWASPGPDYFGQLTASASERGVTVSITARVTEVVWNLGNGETVTCDGPGTPYSTSGPFAGQPSPDCGYDTGYQKAGTYRINATTHWTVRWSGGGQSGTIPVTRASNGVQIQINELQVVTE